MSEQSTQSILPSTLGCCPGPSLVTNDSAAVAGYYRAVRYIMGKGGCLNDKEAVDNLLLAANGKYPPAMNTLGECYYHARFEELLGEDYATAHALWVEAAERGLADAAYNLGDDAEFSMITDGECQCPDEARRWYLKAARQGHLLAIKALGFVSATSFFEIEKHRFAGEHGDIDAQLFMGEAYSHGGKGAWMESVYWYKKAAAQGSNVARYQLGRLYSNCTGADYDPSCALHYFKQAVESVDSQAEEGLANSYLNDADGLAAQPALAVEYYHRAAKQGKVSSYYMLGHCYEYGDGIKRNHARAVYWYKKAATAGVPEYQFEFACLLADNPAYKNREEIAHWYACAAASNHAIAQFSLGACYEAGDGVEKSLQKAIDWYQRAAQAGVVPAQNALKRLRVT